MSLRAFSFGTAIVLVVACSSEPPPPATTSVPFAAPARATTEEGAPEGSGERGEPRPRADGGPTDGGSDAAPSCTCGTCRMHAFGPIASIDVPCGFGICHDGVLHFCTETCAVRVSKVPGGCDEGDGG